MRDIQTPVSRLDGHCGRHRHSGPKGRVALAPAWGQTSLQQSHIDGNVPPPEFFIQFLQRDLLAFFQASDAPSATSVEYTLLRDAPTQSGVSYPKFYAWVKVLSGSTVIQEGAVRLAAIQRTHFKITDFMSAKQVNATPGEVSNIFPAPLVAPSSN
jgi:hypothetical protein